MFTQFPHFSAILIVPIVLLVYACASAHYTIHPGALNSMDSTAYDALLIAESTIDQARTALQAGELPVQAKDALSQLVATYNLARASWLTYRGAITTNVAAETYLDQMNRNLADLTTAIQKFQEAQ